VVLGAITSTPEPSVVIPALDVEDDAGRAGEAVPQMFMPMAECHVVPTAGCAFEDFAADEGFWYSYRAQITEISPRIAMTTSDAYQLTGRWPRYVRPPPVEAARCTHFPVELLGMAGANPTAS
jgi:hypothetical protein